LIAEPWPEHWAANPEQQERLLQELRSLAQQDPRTQQLEHYFLMKQLPVDIRHNSKIFREKLAVWAAGQLGSQEAACERS
jgi:hypothetical protein